MTERSPAIPLSLNIEKNNKYNINPNPRTVRGSDITWFNTSGNKIIKTEYNKCTGNINSHMYPWGVPSDPKNIPFNLKNWENNNNNNNSKCDLFTRFDMYGLAPTCINKCSKNGGSYVDPN